jgi:predicted dehydrogenase
VTDRTIRWGILATGHIAGKFAEDLRLVPDAELVAVGSRSAASAAAFAAAHGARRAHGSWQQLAEDPEVDAVYVATPHVAHHAAAATCLRAGKATLCEKPFTLDAAQATGLISLAREVGVFLMEAMWMRCFPAVRQVAELVAGGAIGQVVSVHADFGVGGGPYPPEHRLRARELGGGALLDLGVYPVAFAQLLLGAPAGATARARLGPEGTDESTAMILEYASGALAVLSCTILGDTAKRAVVTGTAGRIELPRNFYRPAGFTMFRAGAAEEVQEVAAPFDGWGYHFEAAEVGRCLRAGLLESPLVPHASTLDVMRTLDNLRASIGVTY